MTTENHIYQRASGILSAVYAWMVPALILTGLVAYAGAYVSPFNTLIMQHPTAILLTVIIAQFIFLFTIPKAIKRLSSPTAGLLFFLFSVLNGIMLSSIFFAYTTSSIINTFFIAAGMFGGLALYGFFTKKDLTAMGTFLSLALWGFLLALIINLFVQSKAANITFSFIGVLIFAGLTAYDVQRIKQLSYDLFADDETYAKVAILGALSLYLDFINLFINLLSLMGTRKK